MIVVDIGCKPYGSDDSLGELRRRNRPSVMFGFDPHPELTEGTEVLDGCVVVTRRLAAWKFTGTVPWAPSGSGSRVDGNGEARVRCFDLAAFLLALPRVGVLKMDAEGSEYELIPHLQKHGVDRHIQTLLIEWHGDPINTSGRWEVGLWHQ